MISLLCSEAFSEDLIMARRAAMVLSTHDLPDCLPTLSAADTLASVGASPSPQAVSCRRDFLRLSPEPVNSLPSCLPPPASLLPILPS